jgi:hypothetical protein
MLQLMKQLCHIPDFKAYFKGDILIFYITYSARNSNDSV